MTPGSILGRSLYALKEGPSLSCIPSSEAVTKHSVSGVPGPSVGTERVEVGNDVGISGGTTVAEKSKVGSAIGIAVGLALCVSANSVLTVDMAVFIISSVLSVGSCRGVGTQATRIVTIIQEKKAFFIVHSLQLF
jgi:hypothetical protein